MTTLALATTAPLLSVTEPRIVPRSVPRANRNCAQPTIISSTSKTARDFVRFIVGSSPERRNTVLLSQEGKRKQEINKIKKEFDIIRNRRLSVAVWVTKRATK